MKYIRTKDRIYNEPINTFEHSWGEISWSIGKESHVAYNKEEYEKQINELKQADTIEELCDEFVAIQKNSKESPYIIDIYYSEYHKKKIVYISEETSDLFFDNFIKENEIYGAIWTKKGLIYVAKMNEKGELELI